MSDDTIDSPDALIRRRRVQLLRERGEERRSMLIFVLQDPAWIVREAALDSITSLDDELQQLVIERALRDPNEHVRLAAGQVCRRCKVEVREFASAMVDHESRVRERAAEALGAMTSGQPEIVPLLRHSLDDSHWRVREAAIIAFQRCGLEAISALPRIVRRMWEKTPRVQLAARRTVDEWLKREELGVLRWLRVSDDPQEVVWYRLDSPSHSENEAVRKVETLCREDLKELRQN